MEWVPLVDVSGMTLVELLEVTDGPVADATRRVLAELRDPDGACVAQFNSAA